MKDLRESAWAFVNAWAVQETLWYIEQLDHGSASGVGVQARTATKMAWRDLYGALMEPSFTVLREWTIPKPSEPKPTDEAKKDVK